MRSNWQAFYDNEWDKHEVSVSSQHPNWPGTNTQQRWPGRSWRSNHGTNSGWGSFFISAANNNLYYDEGGGQITITIPAGKYNADTLAAEIESQLNSSGVSGACLYYCVYDDANNRFIIATDPSCVFELITTNTTNAIWDRIGFDTAADTGFASIHTADYIRIHSGEQIIIDAGVGNVIDWCAFMTKNDNIQPSGTIRFQLSDDFFATIPFSQGLTKNTLGKNQRLNLFAVTQSYRYARILINDIDNPDGYIEVGRAWGGCSFRPRIGFSSKRSIGSEDPSRIMESEGGQITTIQKPKFDMRDYSFDLITGETADTTEDFDTMFASRGTSKELWVVEMPTTSATNTFDNPEDHSYYCHFNSYGLYKHIAGNSYSGKIKIQEER